MARLSIDIEPREVALRVRVLGDEVRDGEELLECDAAVLRRCKGRRDLPPGLETATRRPPSKRVCPSCVRGGSAAFVTLIDKFQINVLGVRTYGSCC